MATLTERIADLEKILDGGMTTVTIDGTVTTYDLEAVGRQLAKLRRQQDPSRRPRCASIKLDGF